MAQQFLLTQKGRRRSTEKETESKGRGLGSPSSLFRIWGDKGRPVQNRKQLKVLKLFY
jgi:hypothetical protein